MGLMDKVKKILFDEDEIEVPVKSDELPKREVKKKLFHPGDHLLIIMKIPKWRKKIQLKR